MGDGFIVTAMLQILVAVWSWGAFKPIVYKVIKLPDEELLSNSHPAVRNIDNN